MACFEAWTATRSEEEQKEQRLIDVMFLCDEWKSSKGGLSTFNREFAINLAQATTDSMKIHCYVSKSDDQDREDAKQHGVNLITAISVPGSADSIECLKFPPSKLPNPQLVIGHGRKLGGPAFSLVQNTKCKWIQFVHVYCEDLGKYKKTTMAATDTIEENEKKHKMEIELCKAADAVVAVGSRLQQKYSRSLLNVKVDIITPGIFEKFSSESWVAVDRSVVKNFTVFMFGRAAFEDLSLKGYDIIANAIGSLGKKFNLTFVGSSPGEHRKVEQWFLEKTCVTRNQLTIRGYCSEQEELKLMFYQSDLVSLPSRTEGFGLVALEAISACVPVLVSGESGIAEALQNVDGGQSVIVESDDDATQWAQRIKELSSQSPEERQTNAMKLRENYRKVYSWRTQYGKLNVNVDVEDLKPADADKHSTASENAGCQRTSTALGTCRKRRSDTEIDDLQALKGKALCLIALNYLQTTPPQSNEEHNEFMQYLEKMRVVISGVSVGSLVITVKCDSLKSLEELWEDYSCGHLEKIVQVCFVTEKILKELNLSELKLKITMDEEEYDAYRAHFDKAALRAILSSIFSTIDHGEEALASQSHLVRSTVIESWQRLGELNEQEQKKEVVQPEKVKGTSHSAASFTSGPERKVEDLFELMKLQEEGEYQRWPDYRKEITSPFAVISTTDLIDENEGVLETRRTKKE
ncbi:putative glycosyltransferase MJ1607 [Stylophora pistillata]|uniref:Putative glycosyltransferase MJ1607 n=1 Tax=Stylophora pistillata TaxID=50429 RepID=A0A2B4SII9_STYPI|nr:putative glycosyltransferase MJ1607 [Stylophora pistillata]